MVALLTCVRQSLQQLGFQLGLFLWREEWCVSHGCMHSQGMVHENKEETHMSSGSQLLRQSTYFCFETCHRALGQVDLRAIVVHKVAVLR